MTQLIGTLDGKPFVIGEPVRHKLPGAPEAPGFFSNEWRQSALGVWFYDAPLPPVGYPADVCRGIHEPQITEVQRVPCEWAGRTYCFDVSTDLSRHDAQIRAMEELAKVFGSLR